MDISPEKTRNFVVAGHSGCGKTSLCDLMLFKAGTTDRCGKVEEKTSVSDYTTDEQERGSSIYATSLHCAWKGVDFFFIDTPGYGEFIGEATCGITAADNALLVVDGVNGIEIGTTRAWKLSKNLNMPRFVFINRLDREMADFNRILGQIQDAYGKTVCVPLTVPIGKEDSFSGIHNVLNSDGIPADLQEQITAYREQLMDTIAESDEELMMRYLDGEKLTEKEISDGLRAAIASGKLVPVFAGSVAKGIGVEELMGAIIDLFASPLAVSKVALQDGGELKPVADGPGYARVFKTIMDPFIGQLAFFKVVSGHFQSDSEVFNLVKGAKERFGTLQVMSGKTQATAAKLGPGAIGAIAKLKNTQINDTLSSVPGGKPILSVVFPKPVMSYAVTAVKSGEEEKISSGLQKLAESDLTLSVHWHPETHEMILAGMGDQHLNSVIRKLKENSKVEVSLASPKIPYRETITGNGDAHYRHKKQSGGRGQFAEVYLRISQNESGYEFVNDVFGGAIPKNYIPAVEKGVVEAMQRGPLAGCVVERIKVSVYDGKDHEVDSSEMAFKIAARMAFRDAMRKANPILLEPIMKVQIMIPDEYMGDITGHLNHKRGRILGMSAEEGIQVVHAEVPLAEMAKYATELRSMTQGRGTFEMEFDRYEMVPQNVAKEIIDKFKHVDEEE